MSQRITSLPAADASNLPLGENTTGLTMIGWPGRCENCLLVSRFHRWMVAPHRYARVRPWGKKPGEAPPLDNLRRSFPEAASQTQIDLFPATASDFPSGEKTAWE